MCVFVCSDSDIIQMKTVTSATFPVNVTFGNLSADTEYEARVIVVINGQEGPMSQVMTTKTLPLGESFDHQIFSVFRILLYTNGD